MSCAFVFASPIHGAQFFVCAVVVSLTIAAVGAGGRVSVHVDRLIVTLGAGDLNHDDSLSVSVLDPNMAIRQDVHAGLIRVVDCVPEFLGQLFRGGQINCMKRLVFVFLILKCSTAGSNNQMNSAGKLIRCVSVQ